MKNGFVINDQDFEIFGAISLSIGQGVETKQRFAYDYSHNPQSVTFRRKKTARSANMTIQINRSIVTNLFAEKDRYEAVCGQLGDLYFNDEYIGNFVIKSVQFSFAVDCIDIISAMQIGIELKEGYQQKNTGSNVIPKNIKLL